MRDRARSSRTSADPAVFVPAALTGSCRFSCRFSWRSSSRRSPASGCPNRATSRCGEMYRNQPAMRDRYEGAIQAWISAIPLYCRPDDRRGIDVGGGVQRHWREAGANPRAIAGTPLTTFELWRQRCSGRPGRRDAHAGVLRRVHRGVALSCATGVFLALLTPAPRDRLRLGPLAALAACSSPCACPRASTTQEGTADRAALIILPIGRCWYSSHRQLPVDHPGDRLHA